jgi:sugar phosphate isomerase/epimerase
VRQLRGLKRMACGLWLAAPTAEELVKNPERLSKLLEAAGLFLITLNGFPYGDFHGDRVKEDVYAPAWDSPDRLAYSLDLALILARCLPPDRRVGTISSLPLGWRPDWTPARHASALTQLCRLAGDLYDLSIQTGKQIRLCLEPEPGCVIETIEQAVTLFTQDLPATALALGLDQAKVRDHLGLCLDVCHQAVMFEDTNQAMAALTAAGVGVGKVQISSALSIPDAARTDLDRLLAPFAEPRYLHQVRARTPDGNLVGRADLPQALSDLPRSGAWRIHYHVPIQDTEPAHGLGTTQAAIGATLDQLAAHTEARPHLEVETYTWQVLPAERRPDGPAALALGLASELAWLEGQLQTRGLLNEEGP